MAMTSWGSARLTKENPMPIGGEVPLAGLRVGMWEL